MPRILTVDVGNTTTSIGLCAIERSGEASATDAQVIDSCALTTPAHITADEARIQLEQVLALMPKSPLDGVVLSCVVPTLTDPWRTRSAARAAAARSS